MEFDDRLKRLAERFLRSDDRNVFNATLADFGRIVADMIQAGLIPTNDAWESCIEHKDSFDASQREFAMTTLGSFFAMIEFGFEVLDTHTVSRSENGIAIKGLEDFRVAAERFAEVCEQMRSRLPEELPTVSPDQLSEDEHKILSAYPDSRTYLSNDQLNARAMSPVGRNAIGNIVRRLVDLGLAEYPPGRTKTTRISTSGKKLLEG